MKQEQLISSDDLSVIVTAIIIGTIARASTIKQDYRQYPSYPNGYLIQFMTGFVAAALGSVAVPALVSKNYIAVTFLTLALQQFRDVRKMEKESLKDLERTEFTFRGDAYIDGIAKTFESRNYLAFITSLVTSLTITLMDAKMWLNILVGVAVGLTVLGLLKRFTKGKSIGDIAEVTEATVEVKESSLYVDGIYVSNLLGTENAEKLFSQEGMAVVIKPKEPHYRINLDHFGQRQAALFEATRELGVKRYSFTRKDYEDGRVVIALVPIKQEIKDLIKVVENCPLLESAKKAHEVMNTNWTGK